MKGVAIITEGGTEAQRNYFTHQSYKATKSQSHLFIQQLFPTGLVCAQQSEDPKLEKNMSTVIRVLPGVGRPAHEQAVPKQCYCPGGGLYQSRVTQEKVSRMTWGSPPRQRSGI